VRTLTLLFAAVVFCFSTMETTLSLLCATVFDLSATQIYWLFGYLGVVTTVMQGGVIGRLVPRVDETRLLSIGIALLACGLVATPFSLPVVPLLVALGAIAVGQGTASPLLSSLLSKASPDKDRGEVLGLSQSLGSLARILGPLWGGLLFDKAGPAGPYVTTGAAMGVATLLAWTLSPRIRAAVATPAADVVALREPPVL
jgi:MFS family permease